MLIKLYITPYIELTSTDINFIDMLDDNDDVQNVYHNWDE